MPHHQPLGIRLQCVVDPGAEECRFHGAMPGNTLRLRPIRAKRWPRSGQLALLHNSAVRSLYAITDGFLVYVQSDIVDNIHGVLLFEISEPAARNSRSQHRNLEENPSSFANHLRRHLYIQTDRTYPMNLSEDLLSFAWAAINFFFSARVPSSLRSPRPPTMAAVKMHNINFS